MATGFLSLAESKKLSRDPTGSARSGLLRIRALITPITLAEVVSGPLRTGNEALAERYRRAITQSPGWSIADIDADVAMLSARMRLRYSLRLPDAIQLAAALQSGCYAIATHDRDFGGITEIPVLGAARRRAT